jgi:hypothetical protein
MEVPAMPNRYATFDGGMTVFELWTGQVTHEELVAHAREQFQDSRIRPGAMVLADARSASFATDPGQVQEFTDVYGLPENINRTSKCALVVAYDVWERAQLFAEQAKKYGVAVIVFNSLDVACTWLAIDLRRAEEGLRRLAEERPE